MRKNFTGKSFLFPMPVLILAAYDKEGKPQCMNAAWGAVSGMTQVSICVSPTHKTVEAIRDTGAFTVSIGDAAHEIQCDYVGVVSGNNEADKFAKAGFHVLHSNHVKAPIIEELKMALECEVVSYDEELRRSRHEVYADLAVALALSLSYVPVSRAYYEVYRLYLFCSISKGSYCLGSADSVYLVGSSQVHSDQSFIINGSLTLLDRAGSADALNAGYLRGCDQHEG